MEVRWASNGLGRAHLRQEPCIPGAHSTWRIPVPPCLGPSKDLGETEVKAQGVDKAHLQGQALSCSFQDVLGYRGGVSPLLLLHRPGLGRFGAALPSDAPEKRRGEMRVHVAVC